jgi:RsiW-degrading membrane proteinase PrsW (M82 family)
MDKITLLIFALVFIVYLWYTFAIIYHFIRFGIGAEPKKIAFMFLVGSFVLFVIAAFAFSQVEWPDIASINFGI